MVAILKEISQSGVKVGIMHGNRDFLIGEAFCKKTHTKLLPQEILLSHNQSKSNYLLMHGDQLCTDDKEHQEFRKMVLSAHWKDVFLKKDILSSSHSQASGLPRVFTTDSIEVD